jgi:putative endopeptidase
MSKHLLAALFVLGCGSKSTPTTTTTTGDPVTPPTDGTDTGAPTDPVPSNKPELGTWGFDEKGMDKSVSPGASFHQYANGTWLKSTPIPADKSNYGVATVLADRSEERTRKIIESANGPEGSEARKIADYYKSFLDEAAIEKKGLEPIKPRLAEIDAIKDAGGLVSMFAELAREFSNNPFITAVLEDEKQPDAHIAGVFQGGLGLNDRDMYDAKAKQFAPQREAYKKYIAEMFKLAELKDADKRAAAVYALEEKLAKVHWTRTENRNAVKTYNKLTIAQLQAKAPGVDWKLWVKGVGLEGQAALNVSQPTAIAGMAKLVRSQPLSVWKDYLTLHQLDEAAPYLPKRFVDTKFELTKALTGTPQLKDRWKRGVDGVTGALGEAIGKLYVEKYFPPATKKRADELVKNLLLAMGQRLDALPWMSAETKAKAKEKLATYSPKIGYPTRWRDYSALQVVAGDPFGNAQRAAMFDYNRRLAKLGQPVDREEWGMTPMTVNAYYNPVKNEIVFPAAILQPPFFDPNADDAVNYGGIGGVIGHEISHGFDDQGSQYDAKGTLKSWWTKEDAKKFKDASEQLVAQYNQYCPFAAAGDKPAQCVKGEMTLGENIADLAGLTIAHNAYQLSLGGKPAPVIDGLSGEQRFFLGWAQVWRRLYRDTELMNRLTTDVHSPSEFRVAVVRNLDAWYGAFEPKPEDKLFLAPDKRVKIW